MGDYSSLSQYVRECEGCDYLTGWWFVSLARLGGKSDIERDWPVIRERAAGAGTDASTIAEMARYLRAIGDGKVVPYPRSLWENEIQVVHLIAYGGQVDEALDRAQLWYDLAGAWATFLSQSPGRSGLNAAARADPRFHVMFDDDLAKAIQQEREQNGKAPFPPVFPVKPYKGD
ncbi:hypothetical protein [Sphingomicrobium marinum]|uniref:hypothetical protein n=1 Tax=Sphingomicrobium marinum TaxID=1227950 RepID=UPI00223F3022|nr:hypothetical protein [Sphingomicrobium marinum]